MKKTHIIRIAVSVYLLLIVVGGTVYYVASIQQEAQREATDTIQEKTEKKNENRENLSPKDTVRQEAEKKEAEREKRLDSLKSSMEEKTSGGVTYYTHSYDDAPAPGVYLRPFVAVDAHGNCVLKHDIYYYYTLDDPIKTDWIFGDHLDITADGVTMTELLDVNKLHKKMAQNAEHLSENYVLNADDETVQALRNVGNASEASIRYYKLGEKERYHVLTDEERRRIHDMVALYDCLKEDSK